MPDESSTPAVDKWGETAAIGVSLQEMYGLMKKSAAAALDTRLLPTIR